VAGQGLRNLVRTGALGLLIVAAAACSSSGSRSASSSSSRPATTSSSTTTTTTAVVPGTDPAFLAAVHSQPLLVRVGFSDAEWIGQGHAVCDGVQRADVSRGNGLGIAQAHGVLVSRSTVRQWELFTADTIMDTAIAILCPQYDARWESYRAQY